MNVKQLEVMIADADTALRRLRVLYDHWFAGIERIEPQQQRDAFERSLKAIAREQGNNTAIRFRVRQLQQRYLTYNTYWKRIARRIEEGTYKRDMLRARRNRDLRDNAKRPDVHELDFDFDADVDLDIDAMMSDALYSVSRQQEIASTPETPADSPPDSPAAGKSARAVPRPSLGPARRFPAVSKPPAGLDKPPAPPPPAATGADAGPPVRLVAPEPVPVKRSAVFSAPGAGSRRPRVSVQPAKPPPQRPAPPAPPTAPFASMAMGSSKAVAAPPLPAPRPAGVPSPRRQPPAPPRAHPVKSRTASAQATLSKPAAPQGVSDQQIKGIYDRYLEARRKNAQSTDNVRVETVAKTVRAMMPKLQKKHAGKKIDFDVVVRDGKVALKPRAD